MKKLIGIKKNFSSFENKELKNLQSICGGEETQQSQESNVSEEGSYEADKYSDSGTYMSRITVGPGQ
jgi:putative peptide modification target (TIGR04139 family)